MPFCWKGENRGGGGICHVTANREGHEEQTSPNKSNMINPPSG